MNKGFTLVEMLLVFAIIAILAVIIMANLSSSKSKARDGQRIGDLKTLQGILEDYFSNNNGYPNPATLCSGSQAASQIWDNWSPCWSTVFSSQYLSKIPVDPIDNDLTNCGTRSDWHLYTYCLGTGSNSNRYVLGVNLENPPSVAQSNPSSPVACTIATGANVYWITN